MQRKQIHTLINSSPDYLFQTFKTPETAIVGGNAAEARRREELNLDLTPIKGKPVKRFHWDQTRLLLEFDEFLFLKIESIDNLLDVRIVSEHAVETDEELIFE